MPNQNTATLRQREYLATLFDRADLSWQTLLDETGLSYHISDPDDPNLTVDEARQLIDKLLEAI